MEALCRVDKKVLQHPEAPQRLALPSRCWGLGKLALVTRSFRDSTHPTDRMTHEILTRCPGLDLSVGPEPASPRGAVGTRGPVRHGVGRVQAAVPALGALRRWPREASEAPPRPLPCEGAPTLRLRGRGAAETASHGAPLGRGAGPGTATHRRSHVDGGRRLVLGCPVSPAVSRRLGYLSRGLLTHPPRGRAYSVHSGQVLVNSPVPSRRRGHTSYCLTVTFVGRWAFPSALL